MSDTPKKGIRSDEANAVLDRLLGAESIRAKPKVARRKRTHAISLRLSDEEKALFDRLRSLKHETAAACMRRLIMERANGRIQCPECRGLCFTQGVDPTLPYARRWQRKPCDACDGTGAVPLTYGLEQGAG